VAEMNLVQDILKAVKEPAALETVKIFILFPLPLPFFQIFFLAFFLPFISFPKCITVFPEPTKRSPLLWLNMARAPNANELLTMMMMKTPRRSARSCFSLSLLLPTYLF
jgi:hypothetical protein